MTQTVRTQLQAAIDAARTGEAEGGVPIGSALFLDGELVATGYNRRVQDGSAIHHAEMNCLENAGRLTAAEYARATLVTTLSPCAMCTGAAILYKIPRIVIGENETFLGEEELLRSRGVEITVLDDAECVDMMSRFIDAHPTLWAEDIGEEAAE
ncbi:nucleoside deaminase [Microbacterium sp.]|jgi:creatinine deaminase|uniref:nucleoside deaminase n=1 Tax=Microbacterium sp. TaxID=51671 RepID=UPI0037CC61BC